MLDSIIICIYIFLFGFSFPAETESNFAENLKLPEGITLTEPLSGGLQAHEALVVNGRDLFQEQVIEVINSGTKLAPDAVCRIPALEKLMSTPEGREKLKNYLDVSPDWHTTQSVGRGFFATRNSRYRNGTIKASTFHSRFSGKSAPNGVHYQYMFFISLDGKSWSDFDRTKAGSKTDTRDQAKYSTWTWFKAGDAKITILDQTDYEGRQMTAKMLELAEKEFSELRLPDDAIIRAQEPSFILYNGMQGGIYVMDIVCNPGEPGTLYVKANEITTGVKLSEKRLQYYTGRIFGNDNSEEFFQCQVGFTIYEGDWEQYYGAHIELWFKPDSGKPERKLFEDDYRIQGWMR